MANITFTKDGWEDYLYWQSEDKKTLRKINSMLKEIQRDRFSGEGKPEPLRKKEHNCFNEERKCASMSVIDSRRYGRRSTASFTREEFMQIKNSPPADLTGIRAAREQKNGAVAK